MMTFVCPHCRGHLTFGAPDLLTCPSDGQHFERREGIWRFLLPERAAYYTQFIAEYETVRRGEGRGADQAAYYQTLPHCDLNGRMSSDWRIRAASFDTFIACVLAPLEKISKRSLAILDMGAGNGWLSNRLALRGHTVTAVDLTVNDFDGLGCQRFYDSAFTPIQAEFDRIPITDASIDMVLFNASLHYSEDYLLTLAESLRTLNADGLLVILDSPIYKNEASGAQMVEEREAAFLKRFGFPSNELNSRNFLTYADIKRLGESLHLRWEFITPNYGLRWALKPLKAFVLRQREPAQFHVIVGRKI